ncbi:OmpW family outer membrane protein, partial [Piscirickettsia salmonis]
QNWPINLDVKKLFVKTTATVNLTGGGTAKTDVRLDPYVYGIGVGYRFTPSITIIRAFRAYDYIANAKCTSCINKPKLSFNNLLLSFTLNTLININILISTPPHLISPFSHLIKLFFLKNHIKKIKLIMIIKK